MSIEHGVTSGAPKPVAQGAAGRAHAKSNADGPPADGFASLLMNLGAEEEGLPDAALNPLAAPAEPSAVAGGPLLPGELAGAGVADAGLLLAQSMPQLGQPPLQAGSGKELVLPERMLCALENAANPNGPAQPGRRPAGVSGLPAELLAERPVLAESAAGGETLPLQQENREIQQLIRQAALAQRTAHKMQATEMAAQLQTTEAAGASRLQHGAERLMQGAPLPQLLQAMAGGESGLRPGERRAEKSAFRSIGGEGGPWGVQPMPGGGPAELPAAASATGLTPEMRVAEQVSYWVARGVQNAELVLDGLGEGRVKVSIELQGQEARVEFRADQAQTRQVLEGAVAHLRELLEREGLVLSGMTVGTSGSQGSAAREQQSRPGQRQARVAVPETLAVGGAGTNARATPLAGRAVDLFV